MAYRVVIVEDHRIMREGVKALLERSGEFAIIGEADTGTEGVELAQEAHADIAIVDIGLPGLDGIEVTREILRHAPDTKVVILSMYDDEESVVNAIRAGARAYVVKRSSSSHLVEALRTVCHGGSYLSPNISDRLLARIRRGGPEGPVSHPLVEQLTPRELQVLRLVVEGKSSKEIAVMLNLGVETVRSYRKTMMKKLGINNVAGLIQVAIAAGIVGKARHQA